MSECPSVITLHKGRRTHLAHLMAGLTRSGFAGDLIVVEMGGVEPLVAVPFHVSQIDLGTDGLPLARARNAGRDAARGDRLIFLDVDCIPAKAMTSVLADMLASHDALICANVRYLDRTLDEDWTEAMLLQHSEPHPARPFPSTGLREAAHPGLFWSLAFAIRAETFDRIGGFDVLFEGYGAEDTDFAFRARNADIRILMCAEAVAFHQRHETFEPPVQHFSDIMRNADLFRKRHGFWPMQGWLDGFAALGLIEKTGDGYKVLRTPTPQDFAASHTS